jgi:hypothetical protein
MEQEQINALRDAFKAAENPQPAVETPAVEAPIVEEVVVEETVVTPVVETVVDPVVEEPVKVKSFDEELSERFEGKFKNADELKAALNTPKEEFVSEEIKHWNELAKKGIKLDKEFFELQSKDFDKMEDPIQIRIEAMKLKPENKGLSNKTLEIKLNKEYNLNEWIDKDVADLTDEDIANKEILMRDAQIDKDWLVNYKKERVFVPQTDPAKIQEQLDLESAIQSNWEKFVDDELAAKSKKLSTVIDEKTGLKFEYDVSTGDAEEAGKIMKSLPKNINAIFEQFAYTDDKGVKQINHQKVVDMIIKSKNYDQAVKNAYRDGIAEGAKKEITTLKNTNFTKADGKVNTGEPQSREEAIRKAVREKLM